VTGSKALPTRPSDTRALYFRAYDAASKGHTVGAISLPSRALTAAATGRRPRREGQDDGRDCRVHPGRRYSWKPREWKQLIQQAKGDAAAVTTIHSKNGHWSKFPRMA